MKSRRELLLAIAAAVPAVALAGSILVNRGSAETGDPSGGPTCAIYNGWVGPDGVAHSEFSHWITLEEAQALQVCIVGPNDH